MKSREKFHTFFSESSTDPDSVPFLPIVELAGDRRVLVENHYGVVYYTCEKIGIHVKYGQLQICGNHLKLQQMTKVKLIVTGRIDSISLQRRERK